MEIMAQYGDDVKQTPEVGASAFGREYETRSRPQAKPVLTKRTC